MMYGELDSVNDEQAKCIKMYIYYTIWTNNVKGWKIKFTARTNNFRAVKGDFDQSTRKISVRMW